MPRQIKELEDEFQKGQFVDVSVITKQPMAPQLPVFVNISSARRGRIIAVLDAGTSFNIEYMDDLNPRTEGRVEYDRIHCITFKKGDIVLVRRHGTFVPAVVQCASNTDCTYDVRFIGSNKTEEGVPSERIRRRPHDRERCGMCQKLGGPCNKQGGVMA